ncbi:unnamed protein product [Microthlaspi erraticum]|uniref:Secreted protein n=1 Tax=Microthlaspi erraticum TaxID=1685480 RepID=A0A6D2HZS6_9BRAS|nr:unnamed protein product [Microthlaspi erraticum]
MIKIMKLFAVMMVATLLLFSSGFTQARTAKLFQIESKPIQFPTEPIPSPLNQDVKVSVEQFPILPLPPYCPGTPGCPPKPHML